jgi:hypothetical protein
MGAALALVLHRTDDSHRRVVYGSRQSRLHLNLFVKMASACLCGVPQRHPASIILGDMSDSLNGCPAPGLPARRKRTGSLGLIEHDILPRVILEDQKLRGGQ